MGSLVMPDLVIPLPCRRPELTIRPLGENGQCVVKNPRTGEYFSLGPIEHFLLTQLDGKQTAETVAGDFKRQFGEPLSETDLEEFVELARTQGFLQSAECGGRN